MGTEELIKEISKNKEKKKGKGLKIFLVITIVILLGILSYIFLIKPYLQNLVNEAVTYGSAYTIYTLMNEAVKCKEIPLTLGNQTINIIATGCLK